MPFHGLGFGVPSHDIRSICRNDHDAVPHDSRDTCMFWKKVAVGLRRFLEGPRPRSCFWGVSPPKQVPHSFILVV